MTDEDEARILSQSGDPSAVQRLKEMHAAAFARGDLNLAAEIVDYLGRQGVTVDEPTVSEPETAVAPEPEKAVKPTRKKA